MLLHTHAYFYIINVVAFLNTINNPPAVQLGQQATPLSDDAMYTLAQRIVQMTQAYANEQLTNGNGTNFWDQFCATNVLVASCTGYIHTYIYVFFEVV